MGSSRRVFVSHIHEEAALAGVIRTWVEDAFDAYSVKAFVSSDRRDLPAGRKWLDVVRGNLEDCAVLIAVLSPTSIKRPWPNIELGAAWIGGVTVIPFCHSGIKAAQLDRPFGDFHGVNIDNKDPGRDLLGGIGDALNIKHPTKLHFDDFNAQLRAAAAATEHEAPAAAPSRLVGPDLPEEQIHILRSLAAATDSGGLGEEGIHIDALAANARVSPARLKYHLNELQERDYLHVRYYTGGPDVVLLPDGAGWLIKHDLMPPS
jgi:hypothetical protein